MTTFLALLLGLVLPGLAAAVLLARRWPTAQSPATGVFIAQALAMGTGVWLISSGFLARFVGLTATSGWIMTSLLAAASVAFLLLPRSRALLRGRGRDALDLAIVILLAAAVWWPVGVAAFRITWGSTGGTPWYYWNLADQVAEHHHVPLTSTEWGMTVPFLGDYHLFTTATAMLLQQGGSGVSALHAVMAVAVVLVACGAFALAAALGAPRPAAFLAVPVAVGTGVAALKLTAYRPEAFGLGLLLIVAACFVWWLRSADRTALVCTCVAGLAVYGVHGVAAVTAVVLFGAATVAFAPGRPGIRRYAMQAGLAAVLVGAVILVVGLALGMKMSAVSAGGLVDRGGTEDPTWQFLRAIGGRPFTSPPDNGAVFDRGIDSTYAGGLELWLVGVTVALAIVVLVVASGRDVLARRQLAFFLLAAVALAALAAVFALGWEGYVPRRTGQRFTAEASILAGPLIACGAGHLLQPRRSRAGRRAPPRDRSAAPVWVLAALLAVGGCLTGLTLAHTRGSDYPSQQDVEVLRSLEIPSHATVLTNGYNEGYIEQTTGAHGLVGGRAPYTFPTILDRALQVLTEAKEFYRAPKAHEAFLQREGIDYVLVGRDSALGRAPFRGGVNLTGLDSLPVLTEIATTPDLVVYRVEAPA
ncbi:MAG TPA: DUF6541 family protein [Nocardioides sp.]|nr:DUF6541 family protein [Nocardioides sp.]